MAATGDGKSARRSARPIRPAVAALVAFAANAALALAASAALAQPSGCSLVADDHNRSEKILRCGSDLALRNTPGTIYRLITKEGQPLPTGAELDSGALLIEGTRDFQILTPHAITAVRGTRWAVQVTAKRTSTLVLSGVVEVRRGRQKASLRAGEGVDVGSGSGPIEVKRWKQKRVRALLASFGQ